MKENISREVYVLSVIAWRLWRPRSGPLEVHLTLGNHSTAPRTMLRFCGREKLIEFRDKLTGIIRSIDNGKLESTPD